MRFLVVGAGSTGVALGTALGCDGNDVSFVDLPGEVALLGGSPFVFEREGKRSELAAPALRPTASGLFDYVLLCVRLHEVDAALPALREHLAHDAAVVTLQPGTAAALRAAEVLGAAAVLPASLDAAVGLTAPGHAHQESGTIAMTVGEAAPTDSWRVEVLDAALGSAGIECRALPAPAGEVDAQNARFAGEAPILETLTAALARDLEFLSDAVPAPNGSGLSAAATSSTAATNAAAAIESAASLDIAAGVRPDIITAALGDGTLPRALAELAALPLPRRQTFSAMPAIQVAASRKTTVR